MASRSPSAASCPMRRLLDRNPSTKPADVVRMENSSRIRWVFQPLRLPIRWKKMSQKPTQTRSLRTMAPT